MCADNLSNINKFFTTGQQCFSENVSQPQETVGFIGLGNMGSYMAQNLMKSGYSLIVNDVYPEAMAPLKGLGARTVSSPAEVAKDAKMIITMLPSRYSNIHKQ